MPLIFGLEGEMFFGASAALETHFQRIKRPIRRAHARGRAPTQAGSQCGCRWHDPCSRTSSIASRHAVCMFFCAVCVGDLAHRMETTRLQRRHPHSDLLRRESPTYQHDSGDSSRVPTHRRSLRVLSAPRLRRGQPFATLRLLSASTHAQNRLAGETRAKSVRLVYSAARSLGLPAGWASWHMVPEPIPATEHRPVASKGRPAFWFMDRSQRIFRARFDFEWDVTHRARCLHFRSRVRTRCKAIPPTSNPS